MGDVLDGILKKQLVSGPEAISADYESEAIDIDFREDEFAIQIQYENGIAVDMVLSLEVSNNGIAFSEVADSQQAISDASGSHIWDIAGMGPSFVRVKITVNAGSMDLTEILYCAKRRH